jgi:23S rRNA (pseudouridine1915-N3)-methyltransferase
VPEEPAGRKYTEAHRCEREGISILKRLSALDSMYLVVVDPAGKQLDSPGFARFLERQCYDSARTLTFVVGGPAGIATNVKEKADMLLGLSRMTLPHDMARLLLVEQLYRGFTIIKGMPYDR